MTTTKEENQGRLRGEDGEVRSNCVGRDGMGAMQRALQCRRRPRHISVDDSRAGFVRARKNEGIGVRRKVRKGEAGLQ